MILNRTLQILFVFLIATGHFRAHAGAEFPNDRKLFSSSEMFTSVTFEIKALDGLPFDRSQPQYTGIGKLVIGNGESAYNIEYVYPGLPEFRVNNHRNYGDIDYDKYGRLIYWRPVSAIAYFSKSGGKKITTSQCWLVDKNGNATKLRESYSMEILPPGETDYFATQVVMAMGVGFSKRLPNIENIDNILSGSSELVSLHNPDARIGPSVGAWDIKVDPKTQITRYAAFQLRATGLDTTIISTSGTIENKGIKIAQFGQIKSSENDPGARFHFRSIEQGAQFHTFLTGIKSKVETTGSERRIKKLNF